MAKISITKETPLQDDVREMISELNSYLDPLSPPEFQFQMSVEEMADENTSVFVARDENKNAIAMGSLKTHPDEYGEVKRMYSRPAARGKGIGASLLDTIIDLAQEKNITELKLETGEGPGFAAACHLYEQKGFTQCGPFSDYPDSQWSRFYEKKLK